MKKLVYLLVICWLLNACYQEVSIPVKAEFTVAAKNENFTIPVSMVITNSSVGSETYLWTFEGGQPATSNSKNPGEVIYKKAGTYTIKLEASNYDGEKQLIEKKIVIDDKLLVNFDYAFIDDSYAPAKIQFNNLSSGSEKFEWAFEGGVPATSTEKSPKVTFEIGGKHKVSLKILNERKSQTKDSIIVLKDELTPDFLFQASPEDEEYEAPLKILLKNTSSGNTKNKWSFIGANLSQSDEKEPVLIFPKAGKFSVALEVSNGKKSKILSKEIIVNPDKGFHIIKDFKLGISSANVGYYFSSSLRRAFKENENISKTEAGAIDFIFFGLNENFNYNQFASPTQAEELGFLKIDYATQTKVLNTQTLINVADFTTLDLNRLKAMDIKNTNEITKFFGNVSPRIILFETQKGKKGAICLKKTVKDGVNSYLLVDVKVMK